MNIKNDPAAASVVKALEDDPFYHSICAPYMQDTARRRAILAQYFSYSIQEGKDIGRCVHLADPACGVAVWLLPQTLDVTARAAHKKQAFLERTLGAEGCANYHRIVNFMHAESANIVSDDTWYLSIVAIDPRTQGQGLGRKLLEPTLAEADCAAVTCYLETFSFRNHSFYERLGFVTQAQFREPTTNADYAVMVRPPAHQTG